jgi:hypothetical protein
MSAAHFLPAALSLLLLAASCSTPTTIRTPAKENAMPATQYDASYIDEDDKLEKLGRIAITNGVLSIVSLLKESERAHVQKSLDDLNNQPFLVVKAPPKGKERYALGATEHERGEPGFDEVLIRKLEDSHGIRLSPAK